MTAMSYRLKKYLVETLGPSGLYKLASIVSKRNPRILMYHRFSEHPEEGKVSANTLDLQITEIKKYYRILPLSSVVYNRQRGLPQPENAVVITIDDGYADFFRIAYPVLKSHGVPAIIYITTRFVQGDIWLWPDKVRYILDHAVIQDGTLSLDGIIISHNSDSSGNNMRMKIWDRLMEHFICMEPATRDSKIDEMAELAGIKVGPVPPIEYAAMDWDNIKVLSANRISIGAHTRTHPVLSALNKQQAFEEILGSKKDIENQLGISVNDFCYPNGQSGDYTDETTAIVASCGYTNAVTAFHDRKSIQDLFAIRRYGISENMYQFRKIIHGLVNIKNNFSLYD